MVGGEVVLEKSVVDGGTHQDDAHSGELPNDSFDGEEDEIGVDVSLVNLIQYDERVLVEEVSAVDHSLQEDAVSDKHDLVFGVDHRLHADLVADFVSVLHLLLQDGLQVDHCQSSGLHAHDLGLLACGLEILVNQSGDLCRFAASRFSSH